MKSPNEINVAIVNALGIPLDNLRSAVIELDGGRFPVIKAVYIAQPVRIDKDGGVAEVMKRFDLVLREESGS